MDLESLAYLGEVIGAAAVVASLLYLAIQVRQSTRAQQTENYSRALERVSTMQGTLSQDNNLSRIFATGVEDASRLTTLEKIRFTWALYEAFDAFEFMFYTYKNEEIPEEVWARWSDTVAWWLIFPGVQEWWASRPVKFSDSFTEFVEAILQNNPTDPARHGRWLAFVSSGAETRNESNQ